MEERNDHFRDGETVGCFQNELVKIELQLVVAVVRIGEHVEWPVHLSAVVAGALDLLGALPVDEGVGTVGFLCDKIHGTGGVDLLKPDAPLGAVGYEIVLAHVGVVPIEEILHFLLEIHGARILKHPFQNGMHVSSTVGSVIAREVPPKTKFLISTSSEETIEVDF